MVANLAACDVVAVAPVVGTSAATRRRSAVIANHHYGSDDRIVAGARPVHRMIDDRIVARPRPVQRRVACHLGVMMVFASPVAVTAIDAAAVSAVSEMSATAMAASAIVGESSAGTSSNQQDERTAGNKMQACLCDRANPHDALPALFDVGIAWPRQCATATLISEAITGRRSERIFNG